MIKGQVLSPCTVQCTQIRFKYASHTTVKECPWHACDFDMYWLRCIMSCDFNWHKNPWYTDVLFITTHVRSTSRANGNSRFLLIRLGIDIHYQAVFTVSYTHNFDLYAVAKCSRALHTGILGLLVSLTRQYFKMFFLVSHTSKKSFLMSSDVL